MIDLHPLIDPQFWFALQPDYLSPFFEKLFFAFFALIVIFGSMVRIVARRQAPDRYAKRAMLSVGGMLMVMGFIGLAWFFFAYEGLYILGARFWFLIWLAGLIFWIYSLVRFIRKDIPEMKAMEKHRKEVNKYLPRKKR